MKIKSFNEFNNDPSDGLRKRDLKESKAKRHNLRQTLRTIDDWSQYEDDEEFSPFEKTRKR